MRRSGVEQPVRAARLERDDRGWRRPAFRRGGMSATPVAHHLCAGSAHAAVAEFAGSELIPARQPIPAPKPHGPGPAAEARDAR